ncbi:MAG: hypothetical protein IJI43_01950 [Bacilli bacterium]|nr:hypothetical protein [Bacilli bacterium]
MAFSLSGSYKKAQEKNKKYYTQLKKDQKKVINSIKKETSAAAKKAAKNNKKFQISKTYKKAQESNKKYYAQLEKEHAKRRKAAKEAAKAAKKKPTKISNKYNSYRGAEGQKRLKKISAADKKAREKARKQAAAKKKAAATTIPVNGKNYTKKQLKAKSKAQKKAAATTIPINGKNYTKEQLKKLKTKSNKQKLQDLYDRGQISKKELAGLGYTIKNGKVIKAKADYSIKGKDLSEKISGNNGNNGNGNGDSRYISKSKGKGVKGSIKSTASKAAITAVLAGHGIGTKGKRRFDVRLLLYGANKLDGFSSKYQVDATTHLQKYIANLESYLNELGNVHQSASNISCFNASITILEKLNKDFNTLKTHVDTLSDKMRSIAKNMIKADGSKTYEQVNKEAKSLKINSKDFNAATASLISSLSTAEKKRLAKVIKKLKSLTSAEVSTKVVSKIKKTKAGKEFYKEYVKANTKTTKKSKSKVNTYKPAKYKSRAAWKKALISKYKKEKGLSDADAKKMATAQMKLREKLAKGKISKTEYKTQVNKKLSSIKAKANLKADESTVKTETVEQIKARNGDSTTSSPAKESTTTTENTSSSSSSSSSTSTTSSSTGNNTTTQASTTQPSSSTTTTQTSTGQSSTTTESASSTGGSAAAAATGTVAGAGAGAAVTHNPLPASNPQPQAASNFAENYSASEGASASATSAPESQVDESADTGASEEGIDFSDNLDGEGSETTDDLTGLENETDSETDSGVIDGLESDSSSSSSKKSSSGTSPVVPVVASVAAAGAAGVGAKIILDKRANSNNEGNFGTENWDESSGGDYGLSSGDVEYYDNGSSNKNDNLIDDDNTDSKYDYKAGSIDEVDVEEKEKKDAEEGIASFNDSIAYDAISDADINATH